MEILAEFSLEYLTRQARRAGRIMLANFRLNQAKEWKANNTIITATDRTINESIGKQVLADFPMVRVIGEEGSYGPSQTDYAFLMDPNDGTTSFAAGIPVSCFCGTLCYQGRPLRTCVYDPYENRMYVAEKGRGAFCNGERLKVSEKTFQQNPHVGLVFWDGCDYNMMEIFASVYKSGAKWSKALSIAYWGALVAKGEFEATIFPSTDPWESAALKLLVEEAGGRVTDIFGKEQERYDGDIRGHLVSNGFVHDELSTITRAANA